MSAPVILVNFLPERRYVPMLIVFAVSMKTLPDLIPSGASRWWERSSRNESATSDPAALPHLEEGLASQDAEVQVEAALGIEALTGELPDFQPASTAAPTIDWAQLANGGRHPRLAFVTDYGEFVVELDAEQAPLTVQRLTSLAAAGALGGLGITPTAAARDALEARAAGDADPAVRRAAVAALRASP